MKYVIEGIDISKVYGKEPAAVHALTKARIGVKQGDIAVILGKSGSGKSTLLSILGGLLKPDGGTVFLDGEELYRMSESKRTRFRSSRIGFVYQSFHLIRELTVLENIRLPFDIAGKRCDREWEREVISLLELDHRLSFYPDQLSGGEKQRTAIARAILTKPKVILADEPTGNLDTEAGGRLIEFVRRTNEAYGQTWVVVTHDLEWTKAAKRIIFVKDGCCREACPEAASAAAAKEEVGQ